MDLPMSSESILPEMSKDESNTASEVMVQVDQLGKCYHLFDKPLHRMLQSLFGEAQGYAREFWALRGVSFQVHRGETFGIIGRNGSGKSTLLQLVAGTLKPSEGAAFTRGRVAALLELGSGFNPAFTGRQNVYLNASILGLSRAEIDSRINDILAYADIGEFVDQPVRNYSTGMVMRLAFAVIVHVDAEVLIIDEALAVGDAFFMQKCMRFLRDFRQRGTLFFVSHDGGAVTSLCDRVIWLEQGQVQQIGSARSVMDAYREASLIERQAGTRDEKHRELPKQPGLARRRIDVRQDLIDRSYLRNDIEVFPFHPDLSGFGEYKARVTDVVLCHADGRAVSQLLGGECVTLEIALVADAPMANIIVGFYVKDRLGQMLFGDNTFLNQLEGFSVNKGEIFEAFFQFDMPRLTNGDYFITVGVADGTQDHHVIQQWLHEAVCFTAIGGSYAFGIIGLPMLDIGLRRIRE